MKLTFESNLGYQQDAIRAVVDLFEGQSLCDSDYQYNLNEDGVLDLIAVFTTDCYSISCM